MRRLLWSMSGLANRTVFPVGITCRLSVRVDGDGATTPLSLSGSKWA